VAPLSAALFLAIGRIPTNVDSTLEEEPDSKCP